jgi:PII-like signaling protein
MTRVLQGECKLLRIFCPASARHLGLPLAEALVKRALTQGLAGATLFDGVEGFDAKGFNEEEPLRFWRSPDMKRALVEIIDEAGRIDEFLKANATLLNGALTSCERAFIPSLEEF